MGDCITVLTVLYKMKLEGSCCLLEKYVDYKRDSINVNFGQPSNKNGKYFLKTIILIIKHVVKQFFPSSATES